MTTTIDNTADIIDSRDVIARIEELRDERDASCPIEAKGESCATCEDGDAAHVADAWAEANPDDAAELRALEALQEEAQGYCGDWRHGAALIRDSYFEDYARELAEDIGALKHCDEWPATCIDWERAARELKMDYTSVEFDGVTYWVR